MAVPLLTTGVDEAAAEAKKKELDTVHPAKKENVKETDEAETVGDDVGDVEEKKGWGGEEENEGVDADEEEINLLTTKKEKEKTDEEEKVEDDNASSEVSVDVANKTATNHPPMAVQILTTGVDKAAAEAKKKELDTVHPAKKENVKQIEEAETVEDDVGDVEDKKGGAMKKRMRRLM